MVCIISIHLYPLTPEQERDSDSSFDQSAQSCLFLSLVHLNPFYIFEANAIFLMQVDNWFINVRRRLRPDDTNQSPAI
jgi:hypothetical protein